MSDLKPSSVAWHPKFGYGIVSAPDGKTCIQYDVPGQIAYTYDTNGWLEVTDIKPPSTPEPPIGSKITIVENEYYRKCYLRTWDGWEDGTGIYLWGELPETGVIEMGWPDNWEELV